MPDDKLTTWNVALHDTFRLLPDPSPHLRPFLASDGKTKEHIIEILPYEEKRSRTPGSESDARRYRAYRQVYQTVGLLYEHSTGVVRVTDLGKAVLRWLVLVNVHNKIILARHAAYALASCQLRNPTGAGSRYDQSISVFPFAAIWRAMLALDGKISSDELNRGLFKVRAMADLDLCIRAIKKARDANDVTLLGAEVITGTAQNDRIIPWMSLASFGWTLFPDKGGSGHYELVPATRSVVAEAAQIRHRHREFGSTEEYVEYISKSAALPKDMR